MYYQSSSTCVLYEIMYSRTTPQELCRRRSTSPPYAGVNNRVPIRPFTCFSKFHPRSRPNSLNSSTVLSCAVPKRFIIWKIKSGDQRLARGKDMVSMHTCISAAVIIPPTGGPQFGRSGQGAVVLNGSTGLLSIESSMTRPVLSSSGMAHA